MYFYLIKEFGMNGGLLDWTLIFLALAIIAGIFGFGGIAQESAWIAKILFLIFIIIYIAVFITNQMG
jgi:uncharacterized membrane protein YtjA (UPF0391 family)